jgi:hypothetical protein
LRNDSIKQSTEANEQANRAFFAIQSATRQTIADCAYAA